MSAIDEVITALQSVIDELNDANNAAGTARTEADEAVAQAVALGATHVVAGLSAVHDSIDKLTQQVGATIAMANDAIQMVIDDQVEPLVRRILDAVVKCDEDEFDAALSALSSEDVLPKALELAGAICLYALFDAYEGRPTAEEINLVAETVAEMETWVPLTAGEVNTLLVTLMDNNQLADRFEAQTAVVYTFIVTGSILAASPKIKKGEWWFNYLDRVEAAIEAA